MSVNAKEFIESGERLEKTAEIIDLDQKRVKKTLDKLGMTESEYTDIASKLAQFSNETLARTLGVVQPKANEPKTDAPHEESRVGMLGGYRPGDWADNTPDTDPIDNETQKPHNKSMSDIPTHIYIDKSIASLEKTMSDNLLRMETIVANSLEANKTANENLKTRLDESIVRFEATANELKDEYKQTRGYFSNLKIQSIAIAAGAVIGLAGLNYALVQNVTGSFALGQSSAEVVKNEVANQINPLVAKITQSDAKIDKMNETLNRLISAPPATPNVLPGPSQHPTPEPLRLYK